MRLNTVIASVLFLIAISLPAVMAEPISIAGFIARSATGSWYLLEETCDSARVPKMYDLDPSQQGLWTQYENTRAYGVVVILDGDYLSTPFTAIYFHADKLTAMPVDVFCQQDPTGLPEFSNLMDVALIAVVIAVGALKRRPH